MRPALTGTTPFPNLLLDEVMPHLKDTEWRVLCVIVRHTLGWWDKANGKRKQSDWLTQTQMVQKTGRDRAALSRALDALVQNRYIEVRSEAGALLSSPGERRQCKGRLFYALHRRLLPHLTDDLSLENSGAEIEYQMPVPTPLSNSLLERDTTKSEYQCASKANTTKETQTKENVTKGTDTKETDKNSLNRFAQQVVRGPMAEICRAAPERLMDVEPEYSPAARNFIRLFKQSYQQCKDRKADTSLTVERAKRLEQLLASDPSRDWTPILCAFFSSDATYIMRHEHSLSAFLDSCHIFLLKTERNRSQ